MTPESNDSEIQTSRRDTAGDLIPNLSRFVTGLAAFAVFPWLFVSLLAYENGYAETAWMTLRGLKLLCVVCLLAIMSVAFWTNLKRMADDLYVIRQHIEKAGNQESKSSERA